MPDFYEFFAGGGMVRQGLGPGWRCRFANDFDVRKARSYQANFGPAALKIGDVRSVTPADLPDVADLAWASFPCQDLSLAGGGAGLDGARSGAFYPFWGVMSALIGDNRGPRIVALENVCGTLTAHGGRDFQVICETYAKAGYRFGGLIINADLFVPQSRPRLFMIGVRQDLVIPAPLLAPGPVAPFHTRALCEALKGVAANVTAKRVWWNAPPPAPRQRTFADEIEAAPDSVSWRSEAETHRLLAMMSPINLAKVEAAKRAGRRMVGSVYRRTRVDARGEKAQRAEVRFDDVAGCLRTPAGGSSRQMILVVDGPRVRSRLISARETARLMGLGDDYELPKNYNEAYHLTGDGVVVDIVRHLARHVFEPLVTTWAGIRRVA